MRPEERNDVLLLMRVAQDEFLGLTGSELTVNERALVQSILTAVVRAVGEEPGHGRPGSSGTIGTGWVRPG